MFSNLNNKHLWILFLVAFLNFFSGAAQPSSSEKYIKESKLNIREKFSSSRINLEDLTTFLLNSALKRKIIGYDSLNNEIENKILKQIAYLCLPFEFVTIREEIIIDSNQIRRGKKYLLLSSDQSLFQQKFKPEIVELLKFEYNDILKILKENQNIRCFNIPLLYETTFYKFLDSSIYEPDIICLFKDKNLIFKKERTSLNIMDSLRRGFVEIETLKTTFLNKDLFNSELAQDTLFPVLKFYRYSIPFQPTDQSFNTELDISINDNAQSFLISKISEAIKRDFKRKNESEMSYWSDYLDTKLRKKQEIERAVLCGIGENYDSIPQMFNFVNHITNNPQTKEDSLYTNRLIEMINRNSFFIRVNYMINFESDTAIPKVKSAGLYWAGFLRHTGIESKIIDLDLKGKDKLVDSLIKRKQYKVILRNEDNHLDNTFRYSIWTYMQYKNREFELCVGSDMKNTNFVKPLKLIEESLLP